MPKPAIQFPRTEGNRFFQELRTEVDTWFRSRGVAKTGDIRLYFKTAVIVLFTPLLFVLALWTGLPVWASILCFGLMGLGHALAGFNIMHDACHGAFHANPKVNNFMGDILSLMGSTAYFWKVQHNVIHHTYTNIDHLDADIGKWPVMRMAPGQKRLFHHRFQAIYMFPLYAISTLWWLLINDFIKYFSGKLYEHDIPKMSLKQHLLFWITKILYVSVYLVLPLWVLGIGPGIAGFLALHLVLGLTMSLVFQLAHVVEDASFQEGKMGEPRTMEQEWAVMQVTSTADFGTRSPFLTWMLGGLNFQVEHHLFPQISHVHYPDIHPIVVSVCKRFGVPFNEFDSMGEAFTSHVRHMSEMGKG
ncbi:MAG: acyl-CoA desaturase [Bacteroidetes bacterium]|nr:acyl-CoA desaturase [Bacteroidota bacterium]